MAVTAQREVLVKRREEELMGNRIETKQILHRSWLTHDTTIFKRTTRSTKRLHLNIPVRPLAFEQWPSKVRLAMRNIQGDAVGFQDTGDFAKVLVCIAKGVLGLCRAVQDHGIVLSDFVALMIRGNEKTIELVGSAPNNRLNSLSS